MRSSAVSAPNSPVIRSLLSYLNQQDRPSILRTGPAGSHGSRSSGSG